MRCAINPKATTTGRQVYCYIPKGADAAFAPPIVAFDSAGVGYNRWIVPIDKAGRLRHEGVQFALARAHRLLR